MRRIALWIPVVALVFAAACGGPGSSSPAGGPATSASSVVPSPAHEAEAGEPALIPVPGFEYTTPPADLATEMDQLAAQTKQFYESHSVHEVKKDGQTVGYLVLMGTTPTMDELVNADPASALGGAAGGIVGAGSADTVEMQTVSGEKVVVASGSQITAYVWYHGQTLTMFMLEGQGDASSSDFLSQYLTIANG